MIYKLLKGNFKTLFLIIMSLSFILTTVVSFCIILDSNSSASFKITQRQLQEENEYHILYTILYPFDYLSYQVSSIDRILSDINTHLDNLDMKKYIDGLWLEPQIPFFNINGSTGFQYGHAYYLEIDRIENIHDFMIPGSRLPQNENETILIIRNDVRIEFKINSSYYFSSISADSTFPLTVVGIISLLERNQFPSYKAYVNYITNIRIKTGINLGNDLYAIIVRKNDYSTLIKKIGESSLNNPFEHGKIGIIDIYIHFDSYKLKAFESYLYIEKLKSLKDNIDSLYDYYNVLKNELDAFHKRWFNLLFEFLVLALPIFIISFYFTIFVVNNTNFSRLKICQSLFIRGMSFKQMIYLLILESMISFIGVVSFGFIFGIFLSYFLIAYMDAASYLILDVANWLFYIVFVAIISIGIVYIKIIRNISRIYHRKIILSFDSNEKVQMHSWAIKILISGIIALTLLYFVISLDLPLWSFSTETFVILEQFLQLLIIISLLGISLGLIFSLRTIFSKFIITFSDKIWKEFCDIPIISLKNIKRYIRTFSDVWLLLTLLVFYPVLVMTLTASTNNHLKEQAEFFVGSDYRIGFTESNEGILTNFLTTNLSKKVLVTKITVANMFYKQEAGESGGTWNTLDLDLLGIDPNSFFKVAYHHPKTKFTPSITKFQEKIEKNNTSVSVSRGFLQREGLSLGDEFSLNLLALNRSLHKQEFYYPIANVTLVSSFKLYPLIAVNPYNSAMIINQKFLEGLDTISDESTSITKKHYFLLKYEDKISPEIIKILEDNYSAEVMSKYDEFTRFKIDRSWKQHLSSQNTIIIIALVLSFGGLTVFGIFQRNSRIREHGIERALGLKKREIFHIILLEEIIIIILAIASGIFVGILYSILYFYSLSAIWDLSGTIDRIGPSPSVFLPVKDIILYNSLFIVFMFISLIPSVSIHQKYDVASLLKRFE